MSTPTIIINIKNIYQELNPAMKRIADFMIHSYHEMVHMGISDIALKSQVSDASVTRFVKQLGFRNFKSFQLELASNIQNDVLIKRKLEYGPAVRGTNSKELCEDVFRSNIQMLSDTLSIIDHKMIDQIGDAILNARNIIFFSVGRSTVTAESARSRLYRLGFNVFSYSDAHEQIVSSCLAEKGDVVIGISNYGRSKSVVENVKRAGEMGAVTVGITSVKDSPLSKNVEYPLFSAYNYAVRSTKGTGDTFEPACENVTQIAIIDCIYMNIALKKEKSTIDNFYRTAVALEDERVK